MSSPKMITSSAMFLPFVVMEDCFVAFVGSFYSSVSAIVQSLVPK